MLASVRDKELRLMCLEMSKQVTYPTHSNKQIEPIKLTMTILFTNNELHSLKEFCAYFIEKRFWITELRPMSDIPKNAVRADNTIQSPYKSLPQYIM